MSKNPEITRQSMEPVVLREIDSGWDTTSAIRKAAAAYIPGLLNPHGHEARCLDKALKSMSTKERGLIERVNPPEEYRNVWAMTDRGRLSLAYPPAPPAVEAPASVGVADSYADLQARAIAAEERAQGLAEKLAEERATSKRHLDLWSGCCDSFEQLHHVRARLTKKVRRMRARLQELEAILADIDTIKDPTIPF